MRVATYSTAGLFAGRVVMLRKIEGPQQWRVVIKISKGRQQDEHVVESSGRIELAAMKDHVVASINELLQPGEKINAANMDFYCASAKPKRRTS